MCLVVQVNAYLFRPRARQRAAHTRVSVRDGASHVDADVSSAQGPTSSRSSSSRERREFRLYLLVQDQNEILNHFPGGRVNLVSTKGMVTLDTDKSRVALAY